MKELFIDFVNIGDYEDFYTELKTKFSLPENFDEELEALTGVIKNDLEKPIHFEFVNMSVDQLEIFEDLLAALEDLEEDLVGFSFAYYLEQYEDEDDE